MREKRFFGVDRDARRALHIACADADCQCIACRIGRGEQLIERPRCPGLGRDRRERPGS